MTGVGFDSQVFDNQMNDRYKTGEGHHAVLPPYTGNFMPPKPDLILADVDEYVLSESITNVPDVATSEAKTSETKPKPSKSVSEDISNEARESPNAPLVKELVSNDKLEKKTVFPTVAKIKFVRPKQQEKPVRKPVKLTVITIKGKGWNMATRAVLMKTGLRPLNTARPNPAVDNVVRANQGTCPISLTSTNLMEDMLPLGEEPKEKKLLKDGLLFDSSSKNASNDEPQPYSDAEKKDDEGVSKESGIDDQKKAKTDREKKYALTENPTIYVSLIKQFWQTATARTLDNEEIELTSAIDGKVKIVTEASVRRHFQLANSDEGFKGYTGENISLFPTMIVQGPVVQGKGSAHPPRLPTQSLIVHKAASTSADVRYEGTTTTVTSLEVGQSSGNIDKTLTMPHDSPLLRVNTLGSDEGSMTQQKLMVFCTTLSNKVESLKQTKQIYGAAYTKLIKKVKKLEKIAKSSQARRMARIVVSDDEDDLKDPSKQRRKITEIDHDPGISLVQHDAKIQGRYGHDMEFDYDFDTAEKDVSTDEPVSTGDAAVTTDSVAVSTLSSTRNTRVSTTDDIIMAETLVYIRKSAAKDKAVRLQAEINEEETRRIARVHESASSFNVKEWEDIQARVEVDEELVQRLQAEEKEKAKEKRNMPPTQAQQRTYMSIYIKNMEGYTLQQLRESEVDRAVPELAAGSLKRVAAEEFDQESSKRQKTGERSKLPKELKDKKADELKYWKIIRVGNHTDVHHFFDDMLKAFDMDDLVVLWSLVKEKFNSTEPTDDKEREIWIELKRLFKPYTDDELWKLQKHIHDLTWKLYDSCRVHHVSTNKGIDIYMLVEKEYCKQSIITSRIETRN
nr:hypothetical protein [Tanacetum cinerariifolium]